MGRHAKYLTSEEKAEAKRKQNKRHVQAVVRSILGCDHMTECTLATAPGPTEKQAARAMNGAKVMLAL